MGDELFNPEDNVSKMILKQDGGLTSDEELALQIIHRFNICRDTLETMPAFKDHIDFLYSKCKEK
jgi:hypothetical protein